MSTHYADLHCHLDLYDDFVSAVQEAEQAEVFTLTVTTTPKAWPRNLEITQSTRFVRAALGLHPQLVHERAGEISLWEEYLPQTRYVGEVGIDAGPRYYRSLDLQKEIFRHVLQKCSQAENKILTVHSIRAAKHVLDLIEQNLTGGTVILHWFNGSKSEAQRASDLGCYFSINAEMLSNARGQHLVSDLPIDRLLTESDGPFTQINEHHARPSDMHYTVGSLSKILRRTPEQMKAELYRNLKKVLE